MKMNKWMKTITIASAFLLGACGAQGASSSSSASSSAQASTASSQTAASSPVLDSIKANGKLVVGTSADFPPYEWHYMENGKDTIIGFDIDIAQAVADKLGVELEIKDMDFSALIASLKTGKVDLVLAGMNPTPERAQEVDFSDVYYEAKMVAVVKKGQASNYPDLQSLASASIGVQKGTIQEETVAKELPEAKLVSQPKNPTLIMSLQQGKLDAVVLDEVPAKEFVRQNDDLEILSFEIPHEVSGSAAAIQQGNQAFVDLVNEVLSELKTSGQLDQFIMNNTKIMEESTANN